MLTFTVVEPKPLLHRPATYAWFGDPAAQAEPCTVLHVNEDTGRAYVTWFERRDSQGRIVSRPAGWVNVADRLTYLDA